jgi:hypothetical protein
MADAIIRYAAYTEEDFNQDVDRAAQIGGTSLMELKQGENVVRFVPLPHPGVSPLRTTGMHYVDAIPGLDRTVVFACPKKELNQPCPVCDAGAALAKSPNPIDRERGERVAVKLTIYANVIDRSAPADDPNHGLRVLRFGKSILEQLKTIRRSPRTGGDFFNPGPEGFDIVISREGEMKSTKYKVIPDRQNSPLFEDPELAQSVIDNTYDLSTYVVPVVPETVIAALESASGSVSRQHAAPASRQLPARAATPVSRGVVSTPAGARPGASLFEPHAPSGGQTVADADFTDEDDDDFGPPKEA